MKTKANLIIGAAVATVALYSCDTKNYTEQDRIEVTSNLENYVDSVENAVQMIPVHNWSVIDERYDSLDARAEKIYNDLKVEDDNIEILEERYETAVKNGKAEEENFERTADMHMKNVETWWDKTADDIEEATQESMDWLEKNFDKLGDESKKKYEEITMKLHKD